MSDLRETLAGDDYWSNALVVPPSLYLSEQQTSAFYHDRIIQRYHALGQGIILPEIHSLHPQDLPSYATDSLFSIYVHTRYRATSQQLQAVVRSLGPNAVAQTMQSFSTRLTAIEKRTGVTTGARWLDLDAGILV